MNIAETIRQTIRAAGGSAKLSALGEAIPGLKRTTVYGMVRDGYLIQVGERQSYEYRIGKVPAYVRGSRSREELQQARRDRERARYAQLPADDRRRSSRRSTSAPKAAAPTPYRKPTAKQQTVISPGRRFAKPVVRDHASEHQQAYAAWLAAGGRPQRLPPHAVSQPLRHIGG